MPVTCFGHALDISVTSSFLWANFLKSKFNYSGTNLDSNSNSNLNSIQISNFQMKLGRRAETLTVTGRYKTVSSAGAQDFAQSIIISIEEQSIRRYLAPRITYGETMRASEATMAAAADGSG